MSFRNLILLRRLSTSRVWLRPMLSSNYKSKQLWEDRFNCDLLGSDSTLIKTINNKIVSGVDLDNLEIDIFINIAATRTQDISQLQEAVSSLRKFRKTIHANTLLPSTSHALCRLFLDSGRIDSLVSVLENRVEFGIFHDPFAMNLLFDAALEQEDYNLGSRMAALIMLQEEFGVNHLNDNFALFSMAKYIESKTDFLDWRPLEASQDPIFSEFDPSRGEAFEDLTKEDELAIKTTEQANREEDEDEQEDDEEKEYVRIPFLRNHYFDNHFDLTDPRLICGKSLWMLGVQHLRAGASTDEETNRLGLKCKLAGYIMQANWSQAVAELKNCVDFKVTSNSLYSETLKHYMENLNQLEGERKLPSESEKKALMTGLDKLPGGGRSLSEEAELRHVKLRDLEKQDIERLRNDITSWTSARLAVKRRQDELMAREKLIAEIKAKKKELKVREEYLYFYDNLKKTNLTRIEYN